MIISNAEKRCYDKDGQTTVTDGLEVWQRPGSRRSLVMTETKLAAAIAKGFGCGRGDQYRPWIRIRRKLSSPYSNQHCLHVPTYTRALHLLSGLEYAAGNVAVWLGATEVREQHPAWPYAHAHPAAGLNAEIDRKLGSVPGLLDIARKAGIDHGVYPGTSIPFVATIDFTLGIGKWHENRLVHWSVKPRELLDSAPNRQRMKERIELERLYSVQVGGHHVVIDGTQFTGQLIENLDWLRPLRSELLEMTKSHRLQDFANKFMTLVDDRSIEAAKHTAGSSFGLAGKVMEDHFRAAAWLGWIDIDISQPVVMSRPLKRDFGRTRARLLQLFGERK